MNNHMTDEALERLLSDYGQIAPSVTFAYRPKPLFFTKRLTALSVAALLSLLILGLTAGFIARFAADILNADYLPSSTTPVVQNTTDKTSPDPDKTTTSTQPGVVPPVTTPPVEPPDVTEPPVDPPVDPPVTEPALPSLLPAWYSGTSIRLVNLFLSSKTPTLLPDTLKEVYNDYASFDLDMGNYQYSIVSGDLVLLQNYPKGHQGGNCSIIYFRPSDGEIICLWHELQELWASVGIDASTVWAIDKLHASEGGTRFLFQARADGSNLGTFLYDRTAHTLAKLPINLYTADRLDFISYSADCNYVMVATFRKENDLLDDLNLIDLRTMEVKQICANYDTFGESTFSADGRYVYTHLRIGDSVDSDENGKWVLYDMETGFTFEGEGQVLYLQDNILISRTYGGSFAAYDCTTGEEPEDLSSLPLIIDADFENYRYTVTVYNPATGEVERTISDVGAYVLQGQYLYYYVHRADGVVIADLASGESVTLPVSAALLEGASPAEGYTLYSLAVSSDGSTVSLGYTISLNDYYDQKEKDIDALLELIQNAALKTNNLPDFWESFQARRAPYEYLIEYTDYDIHDGYVILQISFIRDKDTWNLHLVEDYRDSTFTLYNAGDNPYIASGIHARSAYETKVQTFRRQLKKGDYEASCALVSTIGELRPFYIDYAVCYDANGKWSDALVKQYVLSYEFLSLHTADANVNYTPEALERTLQIITRYPDNTVNLQKLTARRVMDIRLYSHDKVELYMGRVYISTDGKYYLRNAYGISDNTCAQITYEEYLTLMEDQGGFLVKSGMYKDIRIASVMKPLADEAEYDFLVRGSLPDTYVNPPKIESTLAMIREGGHSSDELMNFLFERDEEWEYIRLLCEYVDRDLWALTNHSTLAILVSYKNGEFIISDPYPELPLPASAQ